MPPVLHHLTVFLSLCHKIGVHIQKTSLIVFLQCARASPFSKQRHLHFADCAAPLKSLSQLSLLLFLFLFFFFCSSLVKMGFSLSWMTDEHSDGRPRRQSRRALRLFFFFCCFPSCFASLLFFSSSSSCFCVCLRAWHSAAVWPSFPPFFSLLAR